MDNIVRINICENNKKLLEIVIYLNDADMDNFWAYMDLKDPQERSRRKEIDRYNMCYALDKMKFDVTSVDDTQVFEQLARFYKEICDDRYLTFNVEVKTSDGNSYSYMLF